MKRYCKFCRERSTHTKREVKMAYHVQGSEITVVYGKKIRLCNSLLCYAQYEETYCAPLRTCEEAARKMGW